MIVKVVKRESFPVDTPEHVIQRHINERFLEAMRERARIEGRDMYPPPESPQQPVDLIELQIVFTGAGDAEHSGS